MTTSRTPYSTACLLALTLASLGAGATACRPAPALRLSTRRDARPEMPWYPAQLADANVGGQVTLRVPVGRNGSPDVEGARVVASSHDLFLSAVRAAVRTWRFEPGPGRRLGPGDSVTVSFRFEPQPVCPRRYGIVTARTETEMPLGGVGTEFDARTLSGRVRSCGFRTERR